MGTALQTFLEKVASGGTAWKNACRVVSTSNLTLSGLQTIDGVTVEEGDRVLVAGQTAAKQNGVYVASVNKWARSDDFARDSYIKIGTTLRVMDGTGAGLYLLTSPTSGTIRVGTDSLVFAFDANHTSSTADVPAPLTIDRNATILATADALGEVSIALASSGHVAGATKAIVIAAGTVASADNFSYPSDLDPSGSFDALDIASDYALVISCVDGTGAGKFVASGKDLGLRTTAAPTITSAEIAGGLDKLVIVFSAPMLLPDLTGISLTGTSSVPASLYAVSADKMTWTIDLDANIGSASSVSLVIASTRTWRSLNGTLIAAGTTSVTTSYDFAGTTGLRAYFDPPVDCNVTTDGGAITALTTTGAGGVSYTGTGTYRTTGLGGKPCVEANGTSDVFNSSQTLDAVAAAGSFYLACVIEVTAFGSDSGTPYTNESPWTTGNGGGVDVGLYLRSTGPAALAYVFSGGLVTSPDTSGTTIAATTPVLLTMRLEGGTLYLGVNGVETAGDACGNMDLTPTLRLLRGTGGGLYFEGKLGRWLACDTVPGSSERTALQSALKTFYGIA